MKALASFIALWLLGVVAAFGALLALPGLALVVAAVHLAIRLRLVPIAGLLLPITEERAAPGVPLVDLLRKARAEAARAAN